MASNQADVEEVVYVDHRDTGKETKDQEEVLLLFDAWLSVRGIDFRT